MNGESFISKWGYRIRKLLIILLGLELLIKIGNILLPTVIDADLGDIFRFTLEKLFIFLIYILKQEEQKESIDLVEVESEALEQDKLS